MPSGPSPVDCGPADRVRRPQAADNRPSLAIHRPAYARAMETIDAMQILPETPLTDGTSSRNRGPRVRRDGVEFMDDGMRDRIRLDSIMCVVDAERVFKAPELMELKLCQIAFADMLILNKVDLVTRDEIERIKAWLYDWFHRYRLVESSRGDVPLEVLLSVGRFDPRQHDDPAACDDQDCRNHLWGTHPPPRRRATLPQGARSPVPGMRVRCVPQGCPSCSAAEGRVFGSRHPRRSMAWSRLRPHERQCRQAPSHRAARHR